MACCPIPVLNSCKCLHPAPARFLPSYPGYSNVLSTPCVPRPLFPVDPYGEYNSWQRSTFSTAPYGGYNNCQKPLFPATPYGGYLSRPWETLCGRHPFQGDYRQIFYNFEQGPVRPREWLFFYLLGLIAYAVLPLALVLANLTLILYDVSRLWFLVAALVFSAYYDLVSTYCRSAYSTFRERLQARTQARLTFTQVVESHRPHYNQLCYNM